MNVLLLDCCTKVVKMMEKMMHYVCESNATNCNDVEITKCICEYILWIAIVAAITFLVWKVLDHIANGVSVWYKRQCDVEDCLNKKKLELSDKLIDFFKEKTYPYEKVKENDTIKKKEYDPDASVKYVNTLTELINECGGCKLEMESLSQCPQEPTAQDPSKGEGDGEDTH